MEQGKRLKQVARLAGPMDKDVCRSDEEALQIFREALAKSKGKCNTRFGWMIAKHKDSTIEEIIKFGVRDTYWTDSVALESAGTPRRSLWQKEREFAESKVARVRDGVVRKFLESKGLWDEHTDAEYGEIRSDAWQAPAYGYAKIGKFQKLIAYAKYADVDNEFAKKCPNTMRYWMENITLDVKADIDVSMTRKHTFDKELEWLGQAPDEVIEAIAKKDRSEPQNFTQAVFNSGLCNPNYDTVPGAEVSELSKGFVQVMEHMGIGVADSRPEPHTHSMPQVRIGMKQLMKKTISMGKVFMKLIKQGFDPALAREEVIDQLNQYVQTSNMRVKWSFYPRKDAPTEYDYQKTSKAKKSSAAAPAHSRKTSGVDADGYMEIPGLGKVKVV